ncbi:MAG: alpha/beta hydrolase [Actinomycetota bacterium]|nr:alpha/beta hydrolase [Actinomycetota bacterium]
MTGPHLDHEPVYVASFDGTRIASRVMGDGDLTPLLVVNAVGANLSIWRRALLDVARQRKIVTWDHRGLLSSGAPESDRIDPGAQAEDAIAVLDDAEIEKVALASWSNGTRIALELISRYPERVVAFASVCGGYGHSLGRVLSRLDLAAGIPTLAGVAKHFASLIEGPFRTLASRPVIGGLIRQSGLIGATADTNALVDLLRGMASCDLRTLLASYEEISGDSRPSLLQEVGVPSLVVGGGRDPFVSEAILEEMTSTLPDARLEIYERATHYLPIEYPARLSDDLRKFWSDLGL